MSLILDALRRAERERSAERMPVLAEPLPAARDAPRRRPWRVVGLLLLAVTAGLLAWSLLREPPAPSIVEPVALPQPDATPAPTVEPPVIPGTESIASLDELTDESVAEELAPEPPPSPARSAPAPLAESQPLVEPATPPAPIETVPGPSDEGLVIEDAPPDAPPALTQPAPLRKFREMPPGYRADFPALTVEVHVYRPEAAQRLVIINGRRYRQGERLAEGPLIVEITTDGIVFEHRGERALYTLGR